MKPSIFLQSKFLSPRQSSNYLNRPRLETWLENNRTKNLLLISAPAGYGKTTLLSSFVQGDQLSSAWYQLDLSDNDPSIFLGYLVQALRKRYGDQDPEFGNATMALLDTLDEEQTFHQQILTVLINELFEIQLAHMSIILDDYHLISNPAIHSMVDYLLDNTPSDFQLIIATRIDPPLQLARMRARDQFAELRMADLRFTDNETKSWTAKQSPGISHQGISALSQKTEGWAAALQIVLSSIRGQDPQSAERFIENISGTHRYFFDYLADEVFRRLSSEQQSFLLITSILDEMDVEACSNLMQDIDAPNMLIALESANLFTTQVSENQKWFRYHQLFREFLLGKLRRENYETYQKTHLKAGRYYEQKKKWDTAFKHFIAANDWEGAARVLEVFAPIYIEYGRVETVNQYLKQLGEDRLSSHPELLLQRGNVFRRLGKVGAATSNYEEAHFAFKRYGDHAGVCRALTQLAILNSSQGNYRKTQELATEALQQATAEDHAERARALMALAKSEGFLTGMDEGRRLAEQAIHETNLAGEGVSKSFKANLLQSLGQICWWHGDPQATVRYCQEAIQAIPDALSPITAKALISMVTPHLYWRDFETALQYAERGLAMAQTLHLIELLPSAYAALGNVLTRYGETARAENSLRQAMETAENLGFASYERLMATGYLAYNLAGQGRYDEAHQLAEGALWSYTGNPDTYEVYVCRSVLADVALEKNKLAEAEHLFKDLLQTGQKHQFRVPLGLVYFGLAYIYLLTERREEGLAHARTSFKLIEPTRAYQLYLDQGARSKLVCEALVQSGFTNPFIQRILENLPDSIKEGPDLSVEDNKAIVVKTLGHFQVFVNGQVVSPDHWVSTKARDLLAYFVTFRKEQHPVDRVFTALWHDQQTSGRTAFHTALSRLRKALRRDDQALKYILVEKGDYWLDVARFAVDIDQFDFAVNKGRKAVNPEVAAEWFAHALTLYKGEYLDNLYYPWVFSERNRLEQTYLKTLTQLAEIYLQRHQYDQSLELLEKVVEIDPLIENAHCLIMRSYAALNNHSGVVRQYQKLTNILATELKISPAESTTKLYEHLIEHRITNS